MRDNQSGQTFLIYVLPKNHKEKISSENILIISMIGSVTLLQYFGIKIIAQLKV